LTWNSGFGDFGRRAGGWYRGHPRAESFEGVFDHAAAEVRERILRDARRFHGNAPAVAFLEYFADHL